MVRRIRIDPGKKPPFKPEQVVVGGELGIDYPMFLERLLIEKERDPDTVLPKGMTLESLREHIARERKKAETMREAYEEKTRK